MEEHSADLLVISDNSYSMKYYRNILFLTRQVFDQPPTFTTPPVTVWEDSIETSSDHDVSERLELCDTPPHTELPYLVLLLLLLVAVFCLFVFVTKILPSQ